MSKAYDTYTININRVKNFISLYEQSTQNLGSGRRGTLTTDILRAGVVFLHSTFEEYLRSIVLQRKLTMLENDHRKVLKNVSLAGENSGRSSANKYELSDLWDVQNEKVIDIIKAALKDKISYMTFNDYSQIVASLRDVEIDITQDHNFNENGIVDNYIKRRHKIVHEADNNIASGSGNHHATSINTKTLNSWIDVVDAIVSCVEGQINPPQT